jgi:hypothetical protein
VLFQPQQVLTGFGVVDVRVYATVLTSCTQFFVQNTSGAAFVAAAAVAVVVAYFTPPVACVCSVLSVLTLLDRD